MLASPGFGEEGREAVVRHRGLVGGKGAVRLKTWLVIIRHQIDILTIETIIKNYASTKTGAPNEQEERTFYKPCSRQ